MLQKHKSLQHLIAAAVIAVMTLLVLPANTYALTDMETDQTDYYPGQYIGVSYSGVTGEEAEAQAWIAVAVPGEASGSYLDWDYVTEGSGTLWLDVPNETGNYEIRFYKAYSSAEENLAAEPRISFTVSGQAPGNESPVYPGKNDFDWNLLDFEPGQRPWTGTFETNFSTLYVRQEGNRVTGEYPGWDNGRIDGIVENGIFYGYRYESPSYAPPNDAGQVICALYPDGEGFMGWWRYGNNGEWKVWSSGELNRHITSEWAEEESYEADANHLIPNSLRDNDLTEEISIAEFADLAVRLYEEVMQKEAEPAETPYEGIEDHPLLISIQKAYGLGVLKPIKADTFRPDDGFGREAMARMLYNLVKACEFEDCSFETVDSYSLPYTITAHFDDESDIREASLESVYYLAENHLMNDAAENRFDPAGTATREQAIIAVNRIFGQELEKHRSAET